MKGEAIEGAKVGIVQGFQWKPRNRARGEEGSILFSLD